MGNLPSSNSAAPPAVPPMVTGTTPAVTSSNSAAPPAVPPVVTGTTPAVTAVPVGNQVCAAPLPHAPPLTHASATPLPRPSALTHRHTAPQTQRIAWCARAQQRYAKDPPLVASEVRALFTDVFYDVLNRQAGYTDDENERVCSPPPPALPSSLSPSHPRTPFTVAPRHRFPVHPLSTPTHCSHLRTSAWQNARLGMKLYDDHARTVVSVGVAHRVSSVFFKSSLLVGAVIGCMYSVDIGKEMLTLAETKRVEAIGLLVAVFTVVCLFSGWDEARK